MPDFLRECNTGDLKIDPKTFMETWCARCHRPECSLAAFAKTDPMAQRNATWRERFFGAVEADLSIPKYAQIAKLDFPNLLQKAMRLEISERRGDWSVPEIPVMDGRVLVAPADTTHQVEDAVRKLTGASSRNTLPLQMDPDLPDDPEDDEPEEDLEEPEQEDVPEPLSPLPRKPPPSQPAGRNTVDPGEVMIGGGPAPAQVQRDRPAQEKDPWAPPPKASVVVVKPGAKVQFGVEGKGKVVSDG